MTAESSVPGDHAVADGLRAAFLGDPSDDVSDARSRLAERAEQEGLLDVGYRTVDSPFGPLLVAVSEAGLVKVGLAGHDHDAVLAELAGSISPRILYAPARTDAVARQLDEYFAGRRHRFDLAVDLRLARGFRRLALERLLDVGYGSTTTYAALAAAAGRPGASRAAGTACATNPVPIVVPCHRVVRSDGSIGQYGGGPDMKATLLDMEASTFLPETGSTKHSLEG